MSLFICSVCGHVENTATVRVLDKNAPIGTIAYIHQEGYPCMGISTMCGVDTGVGPVDVSKVRPDKPIKEPNEILLLCCMCNTGVHHDRFPRRLPTDEEKEVASYSKYSMITPYDHDVRLVQKEDGGYKIMKNEDYKKPEEIRIGNPKKKMNTAMMFALGTATQLGLNPNIFFGKDSVKRELPKDTQDKLIRKAELKRLIKQNKKAGVPLEEYQALLEEYRSL